MRALLLGFLLPALPVLAASTPESALPTPLPASRYATMVEQSPFALATAVEAPTTPKESFAANWVLTGLAKTRDAEGVEQDYVTIRSQDRRISFSLTGAEVSHDPDADGVSISAVEWSQGNRKSTVTLKKGAELAKVEFGQETAPPPPPPGAQQQQNPMLNRNPGQPQLPGMPNTMVPNNGLQNQNGLNRMPAPIRPAVPQAGVIVPNGPGAFPQTPAGGSDRRRVRVINSKP